MVKAVKVKICGITNLKDALSCIDSGADALGFVFYKKSSRYIPPGKARLIIQQLPEKVKKVGIFVNAKEKEIRRIAETCLLDMLQFHGNETPEFCRRFKDLKVIKAFRVKGCIDKKKIVKYNTCAYLFDTFAPDKAGGTGKAFNWQFVKPLGGLKRPVFLSGGLNAKNVLSAIKCVTPDWVDVSSSVEKAIGKKDINKVKNFIRKAKRG
ncbi:MAG: phosphoribosylanthranilate isomerase [Candidatus Omnitrophota bacterium]|jgi:phosphoribosylanthranilate isomerase